YGLGRQAVRATEIASHPIEAKDIFIAPTWVVHRDRRWFEEPEAFRPERWAGDLARRLPRFAYFPFRAGPPGWRGGARARARARAAAPPPRRLPRFAYFPFGGGPRLCIGNTFATME